MLKTPCNTQPLLTSFSFHTHLLQEQHPRQQIKALTCCRINISFCPHSKGEIHPKSKVQGPAPVFTGLADSSLDAPEQEVGCFYFHLLNRENRGDGSLLSICTGEWSGQWRPWRNPSPRVGLPGQGRML